MSKGVGSNNQNFIILLILLEEAKIDHTIKLYIYILNYDFCCYFFLFQLGEKHYHHLINYPGALAYQRLTVSHQHNVLKLSPGFGYRVFHHMTNRGLFLSTDTRQSCFYHTCTEVNTHTRTKNKQYCTEVQ